MSWDLFAAQANLKEFAKCSPDLGITQGTSSICCLCCHVVSLLLKQTLCMFLLIKYKVIVGSHAEFTKETLSIHVKIIQVQYLLATGINP